MKINKKWSFAYAVLKGYVRFCLRIYFGKVEVVGLENLPKDAPFIFSPNHQNALLDALLIICFTKKQPLSLARADVFKISIVRKTLNKIKMLPVFRPHDGMDQMGRNEAIFNEAVSFLLANNPLIIFPEGNHSFHYYLRSLKKGILRIAFRTQARLYQKPRKGVQLIPTGIDYQGHYAFRQGVLIRFGKPINISNYYEDYLKDPVLVMNSVRDTLWNAIDNEIVNITTVEEYDTIRGIINIVVPELCQRNGINLCELNKKFPYRKKMSEEIIELSREQPESFKMLKLVVQEYLNGLKTQKITNLNIQSQFIFMKRWVVEFLLLIVLFPFFIIGALFNLLAFKLIVVWVNRLTVKDPQFIPTLRFGLAIVIFPVNYLLWALVFHLLIPGPTWLVWPFIVAIFCSGIIAHKYSLLVKNFASAWRLKKGVRHKIPAILNLLTTRQKIFKFLDPIWDSINKE